MKQICAVVFALSIMFGLFFPISFAQTPQVSEQPSQNQQILLATIATPNTVQVGKKQILSIQAAAPTATYSWDLGNGNTDTGNEIVAIFDQPGLYTIRVTERMGSNTRLIETTIFAYTTVVTLAYNGDRNILTSNLTALEEEARSKGMYLNVVQTSPTSSLFSSEADAEGLLQQKALLLESSTFIGGPDGKNVLSVLSRISADLTPEEQQQLADLQVVISTKMPLPLVSLIAEKLKGIVPMEQVHLSSRDPFSLLQSVITSQTDVLERIPTEEKATITKNTAHPHSFLLISQLVAQTITSGIPQEAIAFILFLPFILVILTFLKQVIGLETIGVYHTMVLTLCFVVLGVTRGSLTLLSVLVIGLLARYLLKKLPILYSSKQAMMHAIAAVWILFLLALGSFQGIFFGLDTSSGDETLLALLPMLLIALQSDKLTLIALKQRDRKEDAVRLLSTYIVVLIGYLIVRFDMLEMVLFAIPETVLLAFLLIFLIGRYAGLRTTELVRFRELFKHETEE